MIGHWPTRYEYPDIVNIFLDRLVK